MKKRNLKHNSSGQVIIITALLVASLLLSTAIYVFETEKEVPTADTGEENVFPAYQQSIRNTLISALADITNGSKTSVLTDDLNGLNTAITSDSYQAILQMNYTPLNAVNTYLNGIWISWNASHGISSAYVSFVFDSSAPSTSSNLAYDVNVTTEAVLSGYLQLNSNPTQVNLTVNVFNEGKPALAQNFTFSFEEYSGSLLTENWVKVDSPSITDFGNGTYSVSFTTETDPSNDPLPVFMLCQDQRGIVVGANVTCTT